MRTTQHIHDKNQQAVDVGFSSVTYENLQKLDASLGFACNTMKLVIFRWRQQAARMGHDDTSPVATTARRTCAGAGGAACCGPWARSGGGELKRVVLSAQRRLTLVGGAEEISLPQLLLTLHC